MAIQRRRAGYYLVKLNHYPYGDSEILMKLDDTGTMYMIGSEISYDLYDDEVKIIKQVWLTDKDPDV